MSASFAVGVNRGSAAMIFAPFILACMIRRPIRGCCSSVLVPMMKRTSASAMSLIDWVIAPEPKAPARPTTVEAWQRRAQWSMFGVFMATRANFCIR